jgi:thymidylate synthase
MQDMLSSVTKFGEIPGLWKLTSPDFVFLSGLRAMMQTPHHVSTPRGRKVYELLSSQTKIDMSTPVLMNPRRKLGYKFMHAEAWWILTGQNFTATITPYAQNIAQFSDDKLRFDGAYGPKVVDQLRYVVDALHQDNDTRRAVINIWRDNPRDSSDIPCTLSLQFLIRGGVINTIVTMRSSDIWLGWPYDIFNFTMITSWVALALRQRINIEIPLGHLFVRQGSFHLYEENYDAADELLAEGFIGIDPPVVWNPYKLEDPMQLIEFLDQAKDDKHWKLMYDPS